MSYVHTYVYIDANKPPMIYLFVVFASFAAPAWPFLEAKIIFPAYCNRPAAQGSLLTRGWKWAPPGSPWLLLAPPGSPWLLLAPPGSPLGPPCSPWHLLAHPSSSWLLLAPPGAKKQCFPYWGAAREEPGGAPQGTRRRRLGQPKEAKVREGTKKPKKTRLSKLTGPGPGPVPYCPLRAFGCFGFLGSQSGLPREPERDLGFLYYTIPKRAL